MYTLDWKRFVKISKHNNYSFEEQRAVPRFFTSHRSGRSIEILQSGIFSSLKYHENVFMINLVSVIFVKYDWFRTFVGFEAGFVVIILSGFVTKSPRHLVTIT